MSTGGGHSKPEEALSIIGVPVMTKSSFIDTERAIGEVWNLELLHSMAEAGRKEKQLATEQNEVFLQSLGWWMVAGARDSTSIRIMPTPMWVLSWERRLELLYLGVRNKFCSTCAQGISCDKHHCFLNWTASLPKWKQISFWRGF